MGRISVGDRLDDRWDVLEEHAGGMGLVYVLSDEKGHRLAAKTVRDDLMDQSRVLKRFAVELETWIALGRHPNLVEAQGTFEVEGRPFLLLEYVEGMTLGDLLEADGPLLPAEALDYALGLARGMRHAESSEIGTGGRGLVHRDLKPSNVFITPERRARVSDFGMVKVFHRDGSITDEGMGLGTPWYLSPEQLRNARATDGRTDVYAAGAMLYEALVGEPPLKADNIENQVYNILRREVPSPADIQPLVSPKVSKIVLRCLHKDRSERYPNFAGVVRALAAALIVESKRPLPPGATSCPTCGHVSVAGRETCPLDGETLNPTDEESRYRSVERPGAARDLVPAARAPLRVRVDGVEIRPRVPRAGLPVRVTALLANPGIRPVPGCVVPFVLPDDEAFVLNEPEDHWAGEVPPSAAGAPRRVSWSVTPLREGEYVLAAPKVVYRDENGDRHEGRADTDLSLRVEARSRLPLVGRGPVMESLGHGVQDALVGRPRAHIVLGAPGMGKTRTLEELASLANEAGFRVLRGKGMERAGQPMRSLHEALCSYFDVDPTTLRRQEITARVVDRLDPRFGRDPDMVAFLAGFLAGGAPPRDRGDLLWMRFFAGAARSEPLALLLDDAHFGEFETMDLVADLAVRAREHGWPLLLVLASRPDDADPRARLRILHLDAVRRRLAAEHAVEEHSLAPLDEDDVTLLLDAAFPGNTFDADVPFLPGVLAAQTEGNPFFLGETFALLKQALGPDQRPLVAPGPGGWAASPALTEEELGALIPRAVDEAVDTRLRQLEAPILEVLEWAAVIGEEFEVDLLSDLCGGMERTDAALEDLERARLVHATDSALTRYRFHHSLLPHAVERRLGEESPRRLRRLHGTVADALERIHGKRGVQRLSLRLSRHLLLAGRRREAFRALVAAAGRLVQAQLFPRARSTLAHAEQLIAEGHKPSRALLRDYHLHQGETARILGQYEMATRSFQSAIEIASASGSRSDRTLLAMAYSKLGKVHEVRGQLTDALYCYGVGMGLREESGDRTGLASSLVNIGTAYALTGETERAREYLVRALELARRARNRRARANAEVQMGFLALQDGDLDGARAAYRRAHGVFRTDGDRRGQAAALNGVGNVALRRGNLPRAERAYRRSLELRRAVGDREGMASSFNNLGVVSERRRDPADAISWYRRSLAVHHDVGSRRGIAGVSRNLGVAQLLAGDARSALGALSLAVEEWRVLGDKAVLSEVLVMQGRALRAAGDAASADAAVEEAVRVAEASGSRSARGRARAARSEILVASGRASVARVLLEMEETADLPGDVASLVAHARIEALLQTELPASAELEQAFEDAGEAVGRAVAEGADLDVPVRLLLQRGRWKGLGGLEAEALEAFREAAGMAASDRRPPGPLLLSALRGIVRWTEDEKERIQTEERAGEVADLLRTKGGGDDGEDEGTGSND